ncbi:MAG: hypothetical protein RL701_5133 [Pseudomonadota bacterium]
MWLAVGVDVGTTHQRAEPIAGQRSARNPIAGQAAAPTAAEPTTAAPTQPPTPTPAEQQPPSADTTAEANPADTAPIPAPSRSGPVAELKALFATEPRPSAAARVETIIEAQFRRNEVPSGLLKSALCRSTVCRVETRWSPQRAEGFMSAFMHLMTDPPTESTVFDPQFAISPEGEPGADGSQAIDVYVRLTDAPKSPVK